MSREEPLNYDPPEGIAKREAGLSSVLRQIRYDLTAAQAKLTEAMRMVSTLDLDENAGDRVPCPKCGLRLLGERSIAEHLYASHDGPEPAHWLAIDQRIEA